MNLYTLDKVGKTGKCIDLLYICVLVGFYGHWSFVPYTAGGFKNPGEFRETKYMLRILGWRIRWRRKSQLKVSSFTKDSSPPLNLQSSASQIEGLYSSLGILPKCRFWFCRWGSNILHFQQAPGEANMQVHRPHFKQQGQRRKRNRYQESKDFITVVISNSTINNNYSSNTLQASLMWNMTVLKRIQFILNTLSI